MEQKLLSNTYLITENQYFPCINWIKYSFTKTNVNILSFEPYRKMSFRNRCVVAGSNGLVHLSVPVVNGRNQKAAFKDVRISYREDWQQQHWRTLTSCYNKSAFFEFYRDSLDVFFLKKEVFLFDLNTRIIFWLKEILKASCTIDIVAAPEALEAIQPVTDQRDRWLPKNFQQEQQLTETGQNMPSYFQVFEDRIGFQPNLSILDLLFNEGPNASFLLGL
jgi:hypothetical protein